MGYALFSRKYFYLNIMKKHTIISLFLLVSFILIAFQVDAQTGKIRGTVIEDSTGEPLFGVTVVIKGTTTGAATDFDGKFEITAAPGVYDIQASFVSYKTVTVSGVEVKDGEVTVFDQIRLSDNVEELAEVIITADVINNTEEALLTVKRKSINLIDGISAASFRKIGDSDAASAAKRITGVSVQGGKYVFVRGLGDRYTKSLLNGVDIPGLDPDRNTLQLDIFPTNVIDNIVILKNFTPELPADFTGGVVNIQTKDFPEEKTMTLSLGLGYNPNFHLNSNYLTYEGSSTDFLGFDNGARNNPVDRGSIILNRNGRPLTGTNTLSAENVETATATNSSLLRGFNKNLAAEQKTSSPDFSLGFSLGNQRGTSLGKLGYNFSVSYKNTTEFYEDAVYGRFGLGATSVTELEQREFQQGSFGTNNVLLGGLANIALKRDRSKYRFNVLRLQNGESKAGIFNFVGSDQGADFNSIQHNLEYSERALTNFLFAGEHYNADGTWTVDWKLSPTFSSVNDPDIRFTRFRTSEDNEQFTINTEVGLPVRIFRELDEVNLVGLVGATREYDLFNFPAKLKFGVGNTYKQRDFSIESFQFSIDQNLELSGDPNEILQEENLWPRNGDVTLGNFFTIPFIPSNPNEYASNINNTSFYVSNEFGINEQLKAIVGVRGENYVQRYTGQNQTGTIVQDNAKVLDELNFFPSLNFIYAVNEKQNLRFSFSRTTARFSFKEASFAEIFDPVTGRTFVGSLNPEIIRNGDEDDTILWDGNIRSTNISNLDLRWEIFRGRGQTVAFSGFYKSFQDAIEVVQFSSQENTFQPRNVGDARVIGGELEFRQNLDFISPTFKDISLNGNITVLDSRVQINPVELASRRANARDGQTISEFRDLAGQAPYIINVGFSYAGVDNGLEAGIYYNVQGETLTFTGINDRPDVFSVPFHSLNLNTNYTLGTDDRMRLGLKVSNILGDDKEKEFQSFRAQSQLFERLSPGRRFSVSFRYSF